MGFNLFTKKSNGRKRKSPPPNPASRKPPGRSSPKAKKEKKGEDSISGTTFKCDKSNRDFKSESGLLQHIRETHQDAFPCEFCSEVFTNYKQRAAHRRKHAPYVCQQCGRNFEENKFNDYAEHVRMHTDSKKSDDQGTFKCDKCNGVCLSEFGLQLHMNTVHQDSFPCEFCDEVFTNHHQRAKHRKTHRPFSCPTCDKKFDDYGRLKDHISRHEKHSCSMCEKSYSTASGLQRHLLKHHGVDTRKLLKPRNSGGIDQFTCKICNKSYNNKSSLRSHIRRIHKLLPFSCRYCNHRFSNSKRLMEHIKSKHGSKPFVCDVCDRRFTSKRKLSYHASLHLLVNKFRCSHCKGKFGSRRLLKKHNNLCHRSQPRGQFAQASLSFLAILKRRKQLNGSYRNLKRMIDGAGSHEAEQTCILCKKIITSSTTLKDHMFRIHKDYNPCDFCERIFTTRTDYIKHRREAHGVDPFKCHQCGKTFLHECVLNSHIQTHINIRAFKCSYCDKRLKNRRLKLSHERAQHKAEVKELECPICHIIVKSKYGLANHFTTKHPDRNFYCPFCIQGFQNYNDMIKHRHSEHGRDPFICDQCGGRFVSRSQLQRHQESHLSEKTFKCETCEAAYRNASNLRRHELEKHTERTRHPCTECPKVFNTKQQLEYHRIVMHCRDKCFVCSVCNIRFKNFWRRYWHFRCQHVLKRTLKCPSCEKTFKRQAMLRQHVIHVHQHKMTYTCEECEKDFTTQYFLDCHEQYAHGEKLQHQCGQCGKAFKNNESFVRHTSRHSCYNCRYVFHDDDNFEMHHQRQHNQTFRYFLKVQQQQEIIKDLRLSSASYNFENLKKLHSLSQEMFDFYNGRRKVYVLLFVPKGVTDIPKYLENPKNPYFLYVGKLSCGVGGKHISVHHLLNEMRNNLSTCLLAKLSEYDCHHFFELWLPERAPGASTSRQEELDRAEALLQLRVLLFAQINKRADVFFQDLEVDALRNLTQDEIKEIFKDVLEAKGQILKLKPLKFQFQNIYQLAKADRDINFTCVHCGSEEGLYTPVLQHRHQAVCPRRPQQSADLSPHDMKKLYSLKKPDWRTVVEFFQRDAKENEFICYSIPAIKATLKDRSKIMQNFNESQDSKVYQGENSDGKLSDYHFQHGKPSTLKKLAEDGYQLYFTTKWTCKSKEDMYRLETALMINTIIRGAMIGKKDWLANKLVSVWDLCSKFTVDEWSQLIEYSKNYSLLEDDVPSFLRAQRHDYKSPRNITNNVRDCTSKKVTLDDDTDCDDEDEDEDEYYEETSDEEDDSTTHDENSQLHEQKAEDAKKTASGDRKISVLKEKELKQSSKTELREKNQSEEDSDDDFKVGKKRRSEQRRKTDPPQTKEKELEAVEESKGLDVDPNVIYPCARCRCFTANTRKGIMDHNRDKHNVHYSKKISKTKDLTGHVVPPQRNKCYVCSISLIDIGLAKVHLKACELRHGIL